MRRHEQHQLAQRLQRSTQQLGLIIMRGPVDVCKPALMDGSCLAPIWQMIGQLNEGEDALQACAIDVPRCR